MMHRRTITTASAIALLATAYATSACRDDDIPSNCTEARREMQEDLAKECESRDLIETAYCSTCAKASFFSYRKANSSGTCECAPLEFSADFCAEQRNPDKLRGAIRFANDDCSIFELPPDGGARDATASDSAPASQPVVDAGSD